MPYATTDQHASGMSAKSVKKGKARLLHGMKEICAYVGKSEDTIRKYIRDEGFPAGKEGGGWIADKTKIDAWRLSRVNSL